MNDISLEIKNIFFGYDKPLLKNINFKVKQGEFVGILGPNGCGKSTLIKNILQVLKPEKGDILCNGVSVKDYSHKRLSQIIGFVPQKSGLNMPLLVKDILYMGRYSHIKNIFTGYDQEDKNIVNKIAQLLRVDVFMNRLALSLSGGEFQRVLLARALIGNPQILLLDEPTSALDINYAIDMMKVCEKYVQKENKLAIIVLHDLNLAALFCHHIILMKHGEIRYEGSVEEVFQPKILEEIYGFSCDIVSHNSRPCVIIKK